MSRIYRYSPEEAARRRAAYVDTLVLPVVAAELARSPATRSALLLVAQYWRDNALDEVHGMLVLSTEPNPDPAQADPTTEQGQAALVRIDAELDRLARDGG